MGHGRDEDQIKAAHKEARDHSSFPPGSYSAQARAEEKVKRAAELVEGAKYDEGKLRFDLIPVRPLAKIAWIFTMGARKYADRNWEKGILFCRLFGAMMRHAWQWFAGETYDQEDKQHHLASVAWTAMVLMELEETHPEFDDRVPVREKPFEGLSDGN